MSSEDYEGLREEGQKRRAKRRGSNTELVLLYQGDLDYDFEVEEIQPYHLRLYNSEKKLEYFPTSNKASWSGTNVYFRISDIEQFIIKHFKIKK